jgi:hypothetical protein
MRIIILLCILKSFNISAVEKDGGVKKNKLFVLNNYSEFRAFEAQVNRSIFRSFLPGELERVNNIQIGGFYNFSDTRFSIEGRFKEVRKGNYSDEIYLCDRINCNFVNEQIGTYFRNEALINGFYELFESYVFIKLGTRYIKSELSYSNRLNSVRRFYQSSIGLNTGLRFVTPTFYDFYLTLDLDAFFSKGRLQHEFANPFPRGQYDFTFSNQNHVQITSGEEKTLMLFYNLSDNLYFGAGYSIFRSRIRPSKMEVYTTDFNSDLRFNSNFQYLGGKSFSDYFFSSIFELGYKY